MQNKIHIAKIFKRLNMAKSKPLMNTVATVQDTLFSRFKKGGEMTLSGKVVYFNPQYRKLNVALDSNSTLPDFGPSGHPMQWKADLGKDKNFTSPFSYYEKNGEERLSVLVKVSPAQIDALNLKEEYKSITSLLVELKFYEDYPTAGKRGVYLQLKEAYV